jgi:pSer/pThr/pTyr-binding forkhead associated (FHA) protein
MDRVTLASSHMPPDATDAPRLDDDAPTRPLRLGVRERRRAIGPFPKPVPGRHLALEDGDQVLLVALDRPLLHIGRSPSADIVIDDASVSRRHAVIVRQEGETVLLDDRSRHGVLVNGERVNRAVLRDGDLIHLGGVAARYVEVGGA